MTVTAADAAQAAQAVATAATPTDPLMTGIAWIVAIVTGVFAVGKPIRDYLRSEKKADATDKVEDAKTGAEEVLYKHLSDQVQQQRAIADKAMEERFELIQRVATLEAKTESLTSTRDLLAKVQQKLEESESYIKTLLAAAQEERSRFLTVLTAKDQEIAAHVERIHMLETRQHDLEIRLARDEARLGIPAACPFAAQQAEEESTQLEMHYGTQTR